MTSGPLKVDCPAPGVARLLINRPEKRNAIDFAVRDAMITALETAFADRDTRAILLGGVGGIFSAGGDLPTMTGLDEAGAYERMDHIHRLCKLVAGSRVPVVSAIEGVAAGGAVGLALLGDLMVFGTGAQVLFPFLRLGLTPDWGQLYTLPQRVGLANARRLLTSPLPVLAEEAHRIALADIVVDDAQVMSRAIEEASRLAALPIGAFALMKKRLNDASPDLSTELGRERSDQAITLLSSEFQEGFAAFAERRTPDFVGVDR